MLTQYIKTNQEHYGFGTNASISRYNPESKNNLVIYNQLNDAIPQDSSFSGRIKMVICG